jgi:hypothetical protein
MGPHPTPIFKLPLEVLNLTFSIRISRTQDPLACLPRLAGDHSQLRNILGGRLRLYCFRI